MSVEDLSEKLKRLKKSLPAGVLTGTELLQKRSGNELPDLSRFIPGEIQECDEGTCFVADEFFDFNRGIGDFCLEDLRNLNLEGLLETFDLPSPPENGKRVLFLDTETTGLSGGTGTYAFQVGIGRVEDSGFRVVQYFMRDFEEEPAQMALVGKELETCGLLVTYNGGTFDLPLLKTRFLFNRVRVPLEEIPHLDLLPIARRLWKPQFGAASLSFLEEKVLGSTRENDIPGSWIPALYFRFLRGSSPRTLFPIFYHNRMDIVALAALTERAYRIHAFPESIENNWERLGVALHFAGRNRLEEARDVLAPAVESESKDLVWHLSTRLSAALAKIEGAQEVAADLWWRIYHHRVFDPLVLIELAKYLEHRKKDIEQALRIVTEIFEGYGIEPDPGEEAETEEVSDWELEYNYSEGVRPWEEDLPVRSLEDLPEETTFPKRLPLPRLTDRFRRELNKRHHRLSRKLARSKP